MPVTLLSGPGAAAYAGCGWWRELVAALAPPPGAADMLDCGDAPGRALEALSIACKLLVLQPCPAWADVADRAERCGARVLRQRPPSLDMRARDASRRLDAWLRHGDSGGPIG